MIKNLYLSRSFVEFGPFTSDEILSFEKRGILQDTDYVRPESGEDWVHIYDWVAENTSKEPPAPKAEKAVSPTPPAKAEKAPAAAKKAPAKKAAKKAAKKSA